MFRPTYSPRWQWRCTVWLRKPTPKVSSVKKETNLPTRLVNLSTKSGRCAAWGIPAVKCYLLDNMRLRWLQINFGKLAHCERDPDDIMKAVFTFHSSLKVLWRAMNGNSLAIYAFLGVSQVKLDSAEVRFRFLLILLFFLFFLIDYFHNYRDADACFNITTPYNR